jgi:hypothetical protein
VSDAWRANSGSYTFATPPRALGRSRLAPGLNNIRLARSAPHPFLSIGPA